MCESLSTLCPVAPPSPLVFMVSSHVGFSALERAILSPVSWSLPGRGCHEAPSLG